MPVMRTRFSRQVSPEISVTPDLDVPIFFARNAHSLAFAFPSTGGGLQALLSVCRQRLPLRRPSWRRAARERLRQRPRRPLLTKNKGLVCENPCFLGRFVQNFLP